MMTTWRFIDSGLCSASYNMALDEVLAISVREGKSVPALRIYGWVNPSVSIGYFQKIKDIDFEYCAGKGIPVVRRPTGGRALLHDEEITYSFSSQTSDGIFSGGLMESYKKISQAFQHAFKRAGIMTEIKFLQDKKHLFNQKEKGSPLCFDSISFAELSVNNKKIIGSAQKRWRNCMLQQGSIPISINNKLLQKIFKLNEIQENIKEFTALKYLLPDIEIENFKEIIRSSFEQTFNIKFIDSIPTQEELLLVSNIEKSKYLSNDWTFRR